MPRVTNKELAEELSYIKGKIDAGEGFAKEHRDWEVIQIQKIENHLAEQNGRVRNNSEKINWITGLGLAITTSIGWIFRKIYW